MAGPKVEPLYTGKLEKRPVASIGNRIGVGQERRTPGGPLLGHGVQISEQLLEPLLRQGITTFLGGNCGMGLAPHRAEHREPFLSYLDAFLGKDQSPCIEWETMGGLMEALDRRGVAMNCGFLAPHAIIRIAAMGMHRTPARREALRVMQGLLDEMHARGRPADEG